MSYTYKRETFLQHKAYKARVILGGIISAIGLIGLIKMNVAGLIIFLPGALLTLWGLKSGLKDYNKWHKYRNDHMQKGICFKGKVVDWGGHKYWEQQRDKNHLEDGTRHTYTTRESDWWIEVEYIDTRDGMKKKFKAQDMNMKGKILVGRRADVYIYEKHVYINIP